MALTVIKINKLMQEALAAKSQQCSDIFTNKFGYQSSGQFEFQKSETQDNLKRLQMAPKGEKLTVLYQAMQERETEYTDRLKQVQNEITKNRQKQTSNMSKAQLKKQEKAYQQAWANTNTPKDSMQLYNAVQYLQNALIAVQHETSNSQKYTLLFRYLHNAHL